jgi:hypothetical protein
MAYTDIDKPSDYFNTKLYTGSRPSQSITGVGFQPDWVWLKQRDDSNPHRLFDVIRGATKNLSSNSSDAESTQSPTLTSFNSDGFSLGDSGSVNNNGSPHVSWNWKAGTSFTNDASATGIGSIDSAGSVNQDAGFSICTFTGTGSAGTIKHGLNTVPKMIIVKGRSEAKAWTVYHSALGAGKAIFLEQTATPTTSDAYFGGTTPTSSVFSVGSSTNVTGNGITFVAYCFGDVKGYSKFSSFVGNGNANGTFVYTGFKPAFVMVKRTDTTDNWLIKDIKRDPLNQMAKRIFPNLTNAEDTSGGGEFDFLSNGFKNRGTNTINNASGASYIYMAFAEESFVSSSGVPATAR